MHGTADGAHAVYARPLGKPRRAKDFRSLRDVLESAPNRTMGGDGYGTIARGG